jgi:hypothetical protein
MAASTYTKKANLATRGQFVSLHPTTVSLSRTTLGNGVFLHSTLSSTDEGGNRLPGGMCSTICGDVFRIPINKYDARMALYVVYDAVHLLSSNSVPAMAIRLPYHGSTIQDMSPAWGAGTMVGTSTQESGWKMIRSTRALIATSTGDAEGFMAGPFETAKYAMNFGPTSTSGIDKQQSYFEVMFGLTTAIGAGTFLGMTTNAFGGADPKIVCVPIEIPH